MNYFVTAIHTDSGKTLASAILCRALNADYWKPVQAGTPTDSSTIAELTNDEVTIHPERYRLRMPASPHAAARAENIQLQLDDFTLPKTNRNLVIEGAGGALVPINDQHFVIDLAVRFMSPVVLVSNIYLGSINHTLLTFEALKSRKIPIAGIIFNGPENPETERIILHHTRAARLLHINLEKVISPDVVDRYANILKTTWHGLPSN